MITLNEEINDEYDNGQEKLTALARELANDIKTPDALSAELTKITVEAALNAELESHLGYSPHEVRGHNSDNSRNGCSPKTLKGSRGEVIINTPRDRASTFEPQLISKGQTRITGMDEQILALYAKGMSTRDISTAFMEMYGTDVSTGLVSKVTNTVMDQVIEWQSPPLMLSIRLFI